jgi:hypothetical protein
VCVHRGVALPVKDDAAGVLRCRNVFEIGVQKCNAPRLGA